LGALPVWARCRARVPRGAHQTALPVAIAADLPTTRRIAVNTPRTVGILLQYAF
jgi:hypothetical protein